MTTVHGMTFMTEMDANRTSLTVFHWLVSAKKLDDNEHGSLAAAQKLYLMIPFML